MSILLYQFWFKKPTLQGKNIENYKNFMVVIENTTPSNFPLKNLSVKQTFMKNEYGKGRSYEHKSFL